MRNVPEQGQHNENENFQRIERLSQGFMRGHPYNGIYLPQQVAKRMEAEKCAADQADAKYDTALLDKVLGINEIIYDSPEDPPDDTQANAGYPVIELYTQKCFEALEYLVSCGLDRDSKTRIQGIVKKLKQSPRTRRLAQLPVDWQKRMSLLKFEFPNFDEFLSALECQFLLAELTDQVIAFSPILLNGPPGIGKSELLRRMADLLSLPPPLIVDFSTAQNSSGLVGTDAHWSNSHEGELFKTLVNGQIANPLVFLDEVEKSMNDGRHNPTAALHSLLEKSSAQTFHDLSLRADFSIDASHVLWVAASNEYRFLDTPIQSRFTRFDISEPDADQSAQIARSIYGALTRTEAWGELFEPLSDSVVESLKDLRVPPREMKRLLKLSAGRAVRHGRRRIEPDDIRSLTTQTSSAVRKIGFM